MSASVLDTALVCWTNGLGHAVPRIAFRFGSSFSGGITGENAAGTVASLSPIQASVGSDGSLVNPSVMRMW